MKQRHHFLSLIMFLCTRLGVQMGQDLRHHVADYALFLRVEDHFNPSLIHFSSPNPASLPSRFGHPEIVTTHLNQLTRPPPNTILFPKPFIL